MLKRAAIVIILFALLGAAANFPLAMWCDKSRLTVNRVRTGVVINGADAAKRGWPVRGPHPQPWPEPTYFSDATDFGYRSVHVQHDGGQSLRFSMQVEYLGWPLPCVHRVRMWWPWEDPVWKSAEEPDPKAQIHWAGAIGNPVILGIGVWTLLVLPFELFLIAQLKLRRRRNACLNCGYPIGTASVCTECGKPRVTSPSSPT